MRRTMSRPAMAALMVLASLILVSAPARAADPVFPTASRVGLVPLPGLVASTAFVGFEDKQKNAAIIITELPAVAYVELEKGMTEAALKAQGGGFEGRESVTLTTGPAFIVVGTQNQGGVVFRKWVLIASAPELTAIVIVQVPDATKQDYPDAAVRAALATFAVRATVPVAEQLSVLPYTVKDLAGFRIARVMPGSAALLTEGPKDSIEYSEQPLLLMTAAPGVPADASDRDGFARRAFASIPGIKDVRLVRAEPLRIGGQLGYEIVADAKDAKTDTELTVVQWLRFGTGGHLRMVGIARKDAWEKMFPRFRAVRDSVEPK